MRNKTIDIARGLAIILMCIGHAYCPRILQDFIYMFHMAFFFITSGYFFNKEKSITQPWEFIVKRIKGLYIPFVTWGISFTFLHNIFLDLKLLTPESHYYDIKETLWKAFTTNTRFITTEEMMGPYWFFSCLFYVSTFSLSLFFVSNKFFKKRWIEGLSFIIFYIIGFVILYTKDENNYDIIIRTLIISFLFYIGYLWNKYNNRINRIGFALSTSILIIGVLSPYNFINIAILEFENPLLFLIYSLSGTYMLMCSSKYIEKYIEFLKRPLSYIGSNTLIILLTNYLCLRFFNLIRAYIVNYKGHPNTTSTNNLDWYWWILCTIFMIILPLCLNYIITMGKEIIFKKRKHYKP